MGSQLCHVTVPELSVAGTLKLTTLLLALAGSVSGANCGHDRTGGSRSSTLTVNRQYAVLPDVSVALHATLDSPIK